MAKHTPGPWTLTHVAGSNFAVQEFSFRGMFDGDPDIYPIFQQGMDAIDGGTVYCSPADARLIAAAPSLLKEGMALAMLVIQSDLYARDPDVRDAVDNLLLIGAKAEGEEEER